MLLFCFLLALFSVAQAALYIIQPRFQSTCSGGKSCTVEYLDNGESPLFSEIGLCEVGLYTGNQQLVQRIDPVDVSDTFSFTFTPNPKAGPNSSKYYIAFSSVSLKAENGSTYTGFSPPFSLENMEGSFESPLPSATAPIPIPPPSATLKPSTTSTLTIGTLSATRSMVTSRTRSSFSTLTPVPSLSVLSSASQISPIPTPSPSNSSENTNSTLSLRAAPLSTLLSILFIASSLALL